MGIPDPPTMASWFSTKSPPAAGGPWCQGGGLLADQVLPGSTGSHTMVYHPWVMALWIDWPSAVKYGWQWSIKGFLIGNKWMIAIDQLPSFQDGSNVARSDVQSETKFMIWWVRFLGMSYWSPAGFVKIITDDSCSGNQYGASSEGSWLKNLGLSSQEPPWEAKTGHILQDPKESYQGKGFAPTHLAILLVLNHLEINRESNQQVRASCSSKSPTQRAAVLVESAATIFDVRLLRGAGSTSRPSCQAEGPGIETLSWLWGNQNINIDI